MALIKCPECDREISDKATACPHCGYPISKPDAVLRISPETEKKTRTIEKTGKEWKAGQLIGILLMIIGFISCISGWGQGAGEGGDGAWVLFFSLGFIMWLLTRVGAWWYHG